MRRRVIRLFTLLGLLVLLKAGPAVTDSPRTGRIKTAERVQRLWSPGRGAGEGRLRLHGFPLRAEEVGSILPRGTMDRSRVFPSPFLILAPAETTAGTAPREVRAIADGQITVVYGRTTTDPSRPAATVPPTTTTTVYGLVTEHSSTTWSYVTGLTELDGAIWRQLGQNPVFAAPFQVRVPVNAGQTVGRVSGRSLGFALVDTRTVHNRFIRPERFLEDEPWIPHAVDPFDHIGGEEGHRLLERCRRQAKPRGGRFAYDVDRRLAGNWYRELDLAAGATVEPSPVAGRLAFVYHPFDERRVIVSLDNYPGGPRQFEVRGNGPDPREVDSKSGMERYDLIAPAVGLFTGEPIPNPDESIAAVLLVQIVEPRRLRMQLYPGRRPDEVRGFTEGAAYYTR